MQWRDSRGRERGDMGGSVEEPEPNFTFFFPVVDVKGLTHLLSPRP